MRRNSVMGGRKAVDWSIMVDPAMKLSKVREGGIYFSSASYLLGTPTTLSVPIIDQICGYSIYALIQ